MAPWIWQTDSAYNSTAQPATYTVQALTVALKMP